ncbi:MAG: Phosphoglycerate kinase [Candidatus Bipolaricaulis sibiricus]|uniref:Phosphoglycerate kinase n=1 Tax=Bipolaricaulis sibiricus TaxID=2501609 RepID=A0A410FWG4_BIPS1|nr:MAG: Phosphoglycerate kinase [Candidatus Bipolaricaulis sibiricus]
MKLRVVRDLDPHDQRVLLRADLNVPLANGRVADDSRIRAVVPTLRWLVDRGARVGVLSHLGRPEGAVVDALRMAPVADRLRELLGQQVHAVRQCVGREVVQAVNALPPGGVVVLENVRFHAGEEENDPEFARQLAAPFDAFVNDAFATAHRAHASTVGVARVLPSYAGLLMAREVEVLTEVRDHPRRPFYVLVGGKKAKDKLGVLTDLLARVDGFLVGGGVAFTFLVAQGHSVGKSVVDAQLVGTLRDLLREAAAKGKKILLPEDVVVARELKAGAATRVVPAHAIPDDGMGLDIGPATVQRFATELAKAGTVVWAGPLGAFETPPFDAGTDAVARALIRSPAFTVVGGGETGEAVQRLGLAEQFGYISTGGGATLDFLRGKPMPALEALRM